MAEGDKSRGKLEASVRALRAQLEESQGALEQARTREAVLSQLVGRDAKHVFRLERAPQDQLQYQPLFPPDSTLQRNGKLPFFTSEEARAAQERAFALGESAEYDELCETERGLEQWRIRLIPVRDEEGRVVSLIGTALDVTGRRRLEEALSHTRDLFQHFFRLVPNALVIVQLPEGVLIEVNERFVQLTGYGPEEVVGAPLAALELAPEGGETLLAALTQEERLREVELTLRHRSGAQRRVLATTEQVRVQDERYLLVSLVDVTEQRHAATAEGESRHLFRTIFDASPVPLSILRLDDGRFADANEAACRLTGFTPEEIVGRTPLELGLWADPARGEELLQELQAEQAVYDLEVELLSKAREKRLVLVSFQRIQIEGEPCLLSLWRDITAQREMERGLIRAKLAAEELDRIKSSILSNLTHEVRTPLTVILGFTSMLRKGVQPEYQRFVDLTERSGRRLMLMLDAILDLAQLEAGTLQVSSNPFNVVDVVYSAVSALRPQAEAKGLKIEVTTTLQRVYARLDHHVLTRVLNNLLDNAVKFTESGRIEVRIQIDKDRVYLIIEDTGVGIDATYLSRVFDEFSQESMGLERSYQGSGLGLAVSRRLVELAGGAIEVESVKGKGSVFTITLPRFEGDTVMG